MRHLKCWTITALIAALALGAITGVSAQPLPPATFHGTVTSPGGEVAEGLAIQAYIGGKLCGENSETVHTNENGTLVTRYFVHVISETQEAGCGVDGAEVRFRIGGRNVQQTAIWGAGPQPLSLTLESSGTANVEVTVWRRVSNPVTALHQHTPPRWNVAYAQHAPRHVGTEQVGTLSPEQRSARGGAAGLGHGERRGDGVAARVRPVTAVRQHTPPSRNVAHAQHALDMSALSRSARFHQSNAVLVAVPLQ